MKTRPCRTSPSSFVSPSACCLVAFLCILLQPSMGFQSVVQQKEVAMRIRAVSEQDQAELAHDLTTSQQVDDYLEFLGKRYQRLNEDGESASAEPRSVLRSWLGKNPSVAAPTSQTTTRSNKGNVLQTLGLADLASSKLLEKYGSPSPAPVAAVAAPVLPAVFQPIVHQRRRLLALQAAKFQSLCKIAVRTILSTPQSLRRLVQLSGGRQTIALTTTAVYVMLFFVVRPVAQVVLSEVAPHA